MTNYSTAATIYVSQTEGNDSYSGLAPEYDGFSKGPLKTISKAIDLVSYIRTQHIYHPISITIIGDYCLEAPIALGAAYTTKRCAEDTKIRDITFESYGKTRSKIIGGKKLTGFKKDNFNGVDCFSIYLPDVKEKGWRFTDLYSENKKLNIARYPKEGTFTAIDTENNTMSKGHVNGSKWFIARKGDLENVKDIQNASVSFFHWWLDEHAAVESYDPLTGKLTMNARSEYTMMADYSGKYNHVDMYYHLENVALGFGADDSWYLDCEAGMLYYKPADNSVGAEDILLYAPTVTEIAKIEGKPDNKVSGIRFRNLDFVCSKGDYLCVKKHHLTGEIEPFAASGQSHCMGVSSIKFSHAENCSIRNCNMYCLGFHAVEISNGCDAIRVENCEMYETGGSGIKLIGASASEPEENACTHNIIRGNYIHHCSRRYRAACGIIAMHTSFNEFSDNEICYLDYSGLSLGWVWGYRTSNTRCNLIRGNHIHHVGGGQISDMGAIYTLGKQDGTVVEDNNLHDIISRFYGAHALHVDEGSSYMLFENNIVWGEKQNCVNHTDGCGNVARKNIFAFSDEALVRPAWFDGGTGFIFEDNDFITDGAPIFLGDAAAGTPKRCHNVSAVSNRNRYWDVTKKEPLMCGSAEEPVDFETWKRVFGNDTDSKIELSDDILIEQGKPIRKNDK